MRTIVTGTVVLGLVLGSAQSFSIAGRRGSPRRSVLRMSGDLEAGNIHVMMNGLPGAMGKEVAAACLRKGMKLSPVAFTGPNVEEETVGCGPEPAEEPTQEVRLVAGPPHGGAACAEAIEEARALLGENDVLVAIDYTHPSAVNGNAAFYAEHSIPFVVGTTGGDRDALMRDAGKVWSVVAPNMAKGIVAMQAGVAMLAEQFPGAFEGYDLSVRESHQKTKADTSGTAIAMTQSLASLTGDAFDPETGIERIRDDEGSMDFGVPEESLGGHAFHTYSLKARDGTVEFQIRHNVCGRRVYADGTADAVLFLARRLRAAEASGEKPQTFSMIDVLKQGGI